jgi:hypothetical protein
MRLRHLPAKVGPSLVTGKSFHALVVDYGSDSCADSRQSGLPFSDWFTRIRVIDGAPLPVNSIMASLCICVIIAVLNLVGDRVFNSIVGLLTGALGLTYALSIGCVLWRRCFGAPLPPARWSLGRWGIPCNIIALLYSLMSTIISFFPIFYGTGPSDMNWLVSSQSNVIRHLKLTFTFSAIQVQCHLCLHSRPERGILLRPGQEDLPWPSRVCQEERIDMENGSPAFPEYRSHGQRQPRHILRQSHHPPTT